ARRSRRRPAPPCGAQWNRFSGNETPQAQSVDPRNHLQAADPGRTQSKGIPAPPAGRAAFALCLTVRQPCFEPGLPAGPASSTQKGRAMRYRTLCKNKEFSRVYARGKSYVHPHMVLYVAKNRLGHTRIGLTATKKVGKAVQRN